MYKKIINPDHELLFTHSHQRELEKPNPIILNSIARAEMYIANTFVHLREQAVYGIMLSTRQVLLETRPILCGKFSLKDLSHGLIIGHVIQANATRLILVHHNPAGEISVKDKHLLQACRLKETLLEYSLLLDDFILVSKTSGNGNQMSTMSLARLGLV